MIDAAKCPFCGRVDELFFISNSRYSHSMMLFYIQRGIAPTPTSL